jgi:hypothetical protein
MRVIKKRLLQHLVVTRPDVARPNVPKHAQPVEAGVKRTM